MRVWTQDYIGGIRKAYEEDWYASTVQERQMACALYFIDKLALRAGHEKDEDEADTVGCCTLKVHLSTHLRFGILVCTYVLCTPRCLHGVRQQVMLHNKAPLTYQP